MNALLNTLRGNVRQYGMIIALAAIIVLFQISTEGVLLKPLNVSNLVVQNAQILILAIGMVIVIVARHIDLSVGSVAAFVGAASAIMMTQYDFPWWLAVFLGLLIGTAIGAWHGFWVAYVGIPAFIVTLASMLLFRGLTLVVLKGATVGGLPEQFKAIGNGFLPEIGPDTGLHNLTLIIAVVAVAILIVLEVRRRNAQAAYNFDVLPFPLFVVKLALLTVVIMYFAYLLADARGLPIVGLILGGLIVVYTFIMNKTVFGRHVYAIGGNVDAATMSGVNTKRVDFLVMMNMGLLSGLAGLVTTARLTAANPKAGVNFELDAIAAAFIGGAAVTGGVGTVVGAIIGGLVMGVLNNGMSLLGVSIDWQQAIKGLVLLLAVAFDVWNKRRTAGSGGAGAEATESSAPPPDKLAEEIEAMEAELSVDSTPGETPKT
ncbi:putative multiple sugar transport system permease protein [Nocardioides luteus]|uniref:Xylose transport system permease protein XylH n=1 Tax=Nocardioides luteus TaxID=1844 RepID=A0ABQ5SQM9_9ACTN|nr:multiple monosaccharide ABC transporter permease [Nocardioides luteus]MDR7313396.1 putative multiple sugar transport system permease protein [Nocardioides luteus]GGR60658.1 ABC transporter permease [Nocardioides luteus]GLJ66462.1 ABC transporter permease [Nocardioides luteus]